MKKCLFALLVFFGPALRAAEFTATADVDRDALTMNDTLTLQITLAGGGLGGGRPDLPPIPGFRTDFAGQSQNFSFINGKVSNQVTYTYVLQPQAPGEYVIPAITFQSGDDKASTQPIPVKVLSGQAVLPRAASQAPPPGGRNLFVTTAVDKKTPWPGEQVTLTFRFYSRAPLLSQPRYQPPDTTGFIAEDLPPQRQYTENVNGLPYQVVELKTALFPSAPGRLTIGPASLECSVQDFSREQSAPGFPSFFDDVFGGARQVVLRSDPIAVDVRALPAEGRPAGFKGDVGRYQISAALDKTTAHLHEPVTLTVAVSGEGQLKSLSQLPPPVNGEFKAYETLSSLNIKKEKGRVSGSKVFTTILKPDVTGKLTLPPAAFSFFDPAAKTYRTVKSAALTLNVLPPEAGAADAAALPAAPLSEDVRVMGQDIRFIKTQGGPEKRRRPYFQSPVFPALLVFPPAAFMALWTALALKRRSLSLGAGRAFRSARRVLERTVARAGPLLDSDPTVYVERLHRAYLDYLGAKMGAPAQGLTWKILIETLEKCRISENTIKAAQDLWERFDQTRFTPGGLHPPAAETLHRNLLQVAKDIESQWRLP